MYSETILQPESMSPSQWKLLQELDALGESFYLTDVVIGKLNNSPFLKTSKTFNFLHDFAFLKSVDYVAINPMSFTQSNSETLPLYKITDLGKKAIKKYDLQALVNSPQELS